MALVLTAPGRITNPAFTLPDIATDLFLDWDARDLSASIGADVPDWTPRFVREDMDASRAKLLTVSGSTFTAPVRQAYKSVPEVRFGGTAALAAGWRSLQAAPADQQRLVGQALTFSFLMRQIALHPGTPAIDRIMCGGTNSNHLLRPGSTNSHRVVVQPNGVAVLSPYLEIPTPLGEWFAVSVVWDKPSGRLWGCVNGGNLVEWTGPQPAYFATLILGRTLVQPEVSAVPYAYNSVRMHARALSAGDIREQHEVYRQRYNISW